MNHSFNPFKAASWKARPEFLIIAAMGLCIAFLNVISAFG